MYAISVGNDIYLIGERGLELVDHNINVYIYGDSERGDEVIKVLEDCGGVNKHGLLGDTDDLYPKMYYISPLDKTINYCKNPETNAAIKEYRTELKLPENPKFKDGDIVICRAINTIAKIGSVDYIILVNDQWIKREFKKPLDGMADEDDFATVQEAEIYHKVVDLNIKNLEEPDYMKLTLVRNSEDGEWCPNVYFSFDYEENKHSMQCCDWKGCDMFVYAIPYEGNEHLLNKVK